MLSHGHHPALYPTSRSRALVPIVLLALALFLLLARLPSYSEPLEWDLGMYTTIARELLAGERLYLDAWDMKPPAIFVTYAAAQVLVGDGFLAVYLLSVSAAIVTLLGVYHAAGVAGRAAGLWAAAFWAAMAFDPWTLADRPNTEVFINAAVAWAFALWVRAEGAQADGAERHGSHADMAPRSGWGRWIAIGLLFALASMYKQVAVAPAACLAAAEILAPPAGVSRRRVLGRIGVMALVGGLCWGALLGYFAATGRGWLIWQTLVVYPRAYSGGMGANVLGTFTAFPIIWRYMAFTTPAALLTLLATAVGSRSAPRRAWRLWAALAAGTGLAVALPGSFLSHYFQLWFVPLAIGAGWGATALPRLPGVSRPWLARAAAALALVVILYPQSALLSLTPRQRGERKYGSFFTFATDAARDADALLLPGETFYTWSEETYVYSIANRRPPAVALWREHAVRGPLAEWLTKRTLEDLRRDPPELFLHWGFPPGPADHPIVQWSLNHYAPLPGAGRRYFPMFFYVRKGGALEGRLLQTPSATPGAGAPPSHRPHRDSLFGSIASR